MYEDAISQSTGVFVKKNQKSDVKLLSSNTCLFILGKPIFFFLFNNSLFKMKHVKTLKKEKRRKEKTQPPNKHCDLIPNGVSSVIVDIDDNTLLRFLRLPISVDVKDEHIPICLRNIDQVLSPGKPFRFKIFCEINKSR